MSKLRTLLIVVVTALVTATLTSMFWIAAYGNKDDDPPATVARSKGDEGAAQLVIGPAGLAIPVAGIAAADLVDTYTQARAGGARVHDAIDVMAADGTPVVAAAPGTVEKLFFSKGGGGITAYVRSDDSRWIYYYAHLKDYAAGLKEGQSIVRGAPIGRVGFTGNADPAGPHLHFAIHRMAAGEAWHEGTPVNPYPLLAGQRGAR